MKANALSLMWVLFKMAMGSQSLNSHAPCSDRLEISVEIFETEMTTNVETVSFLPQFEMTLHTHSHSAYKLHVVARVLPLT